MQCSKCNVKVSDDAAFCHKCGAPVQGAGAAKSPQAEHAVDAGLRSLVLEHFPRTIAYGYKLTVEPENAAVGIKNLLYTYGAVLQYATTVLFSEFLLGDEQDQKIARSIGQLRFPTLSSWTSVLAALCNWLDPQKAKSAARPGRFYPELVEAGISFRQLKFDKVVAEERFRVFRNDFDGHHATWTEQSCRAQLDEWLPRLETVLETFGCLAELQPLVQTANGFMRLVGNTLPTAEEPLGDADLAAEFRRSPIVLAGPGPRYLPLFPLFVGATTEPGAESDPLQIYFGYTKKSMLYLGARHKHDRVDCLARYKELLRAKQIDPLFRLKDFEPWAVTEWARSSSVETIESLRHAKYFPEFYVERRAHLAPKTTVRKVAASLQVATSPQAALGDDEESDRAATGVDDEVERWLQHGRQPAMILVAEAGAGKTSLLCHLTEKLLGALGEQEHAADVREPDDCVLLLLGSDLRTESDAQASDLLFERICLGLGFARAGEQVCRGFKELIDAWRTRAQDATRKQRRLILIVDAVNEAQKPKALLEEVSRLARSAALTNEQMGRSAIRLLVSVRSGTLDSLLGKWQEQHDTPFISNVGDFAQFKNEAGEQRPYLSMRRLTLDECAEAYEKVQQSGTASCPAQWFQLAPATRHLLRHPLLLYLFHQAFAGVAQPPGAASEETIWERWLARTFSPEMGGASLERFALDLADQCLDRGYNHIPAELVEALRSEWQTKDKHNDAATIIAEKDPLERLCDAGLVRQSQQGDHDWISDSVAEQVFLRALLRRDQACRDQNLAQWARLPETPRRNGALARVLVRLWTKAGSVVLLEALDDIDDALAKGLRLVAPVGPRDAIVDLLEQFGRGLELIGEDLSATNSVHKLRKYGRACLWELASLERQFGGKASYDAALRQALSISKKLVDLEPNNTQYLRDLSISYNKLGGIESSRDLQKAEECFKEDLKIAKKLVDLEPNNTEYMRDLSISYERFGDIESSRDRQKAEEYFKEALTIRKKLVDLEPNNTQYLRDLSISYNKLGGIEESRDRQKAEEYFKEALTIIKKLVDLEPNNTQYLRDLSISYNKLGGIEESRDRQKAEEYFKEDLKIAKKLVELEPNVAEYWNHLSYVLLLLSNNASTSTIAELSRGHASPPKIAAEKATSLGDRTVGWYNLACAEARLGNNDGALAALERRSELDGFDPDHADKDPDLESLRTLPKFIDLIVRARKNRAR